MEYHVRGEYTVCRIPITKVNEIKICFPIQTMFKKKTIFLYATNFCTVNIVFPGQNFYCLCNLRHCIGDEWKKCEPTTDYDSPVIELKMTNHNKYDLRMGESLIEDSRTILVLHVYPKIEILALQNYPRIPSKHFHLIRIPDSGIMEQNNT